MLAFSFFFLFSMSLCSRGCSFGMCFMVSFLSFSFGFAFFVFSFLVLAFFMFGTAMHFVGCFAMSFAFTAAFCLYKIERSNKKSYKNDYQPKTVFEGYYCYIFLWMSVMCVVTHELCIL